MGTDYPSRREFNARILIACRDHDLPEPASISFHSANGASMFLDTDYEWSEWRTFLGVGLTGIKADFYGWHLTVMSRGKLPHPVVDEAVSDYEVTAEVFIPLTPPHEFTPRAVAVAECQVPYVRQMSADGMLVDIVSECTRTTGHLGDHADMNRHQWANTYPAAYAPTHSAVTP